MYGHDETAREQLEVVLHRLDLDPFALGIPSGSGLTIIEALEKEILSPNRGKRFGILLLTPDDMGYKKEDGPEEAEPRARRRWVLTEWDCGRTPWLPASRQGGSLSFGDGGAVVCRQGTRLGQADGGIGSQPNVAPLFFDNDSLNPGFSAGGGGVQVEALAVATPAKRFRGLPGSLMVLTDSALSFPFPRLFPYFSPHDERDAVVFYGSK